MGGRVYSALTAIGNRAVTNQDDTYIEIGVPAGVTIRIKKVHFTDGAGTNTALVAESGIRIKLLECSTTMTGGAAFTPIKRDPRVPNSSCNVKIRTVSTDTNTNGTLVRTLDQIAPRNLFTFEWMARDLQDCIVLNGATFFDLVISKSGTSVVVKTVGVTWEEF